MILRKNYKTVIGLIAALALLSGCMGPQMNEVQSAPKTDAEKVYEQVEKQISQSDGRQQDKQTDYSEAEYVADIPETATTEETVDKVLTEVPAIESIPEYDGVHAYMQLSGEPVFTQEQIDSRHFIKLSEMDAYGRCGAAVMKATKECLPTEERGEIGHIRPAGWHTIKFNDDERYAGLIDGNYLYNRSHLLMYALSGLNDDARNLITATRYCNVEGMLQNESRYLDYVQSGGELLYRVTPIYADNTELLCRGVLLEAYSCNDSTIRERVFCYNVQPGVIINYTDGTASLGSDAEMIAMANRGDVAENTKIETSDDVVEASQSTQEESRTYVVNTNTGKFHKPECASANKIKTSNRMEYTGTAEELNIQGYVPCKNCNP